MSEDDPKLTREERLAAKLRENLRRRKTQARAMNASTAQPDSEALSKMPPKS